MIDHSDIVLIYTKRTYGGAYEARKYAERIGKEMVYISANLHTLKIPSVSFQTTHGRLFSCISAELVVLNCIAVVITNAIVIRSQ